MPLRTKKRKGERAIIRGRHGVERKPLATVHKVNSEIYKVSVCGAFREKISYSLYGGKTVKKLLVSKRWEDVTCKKCLKTRQWEKFQEKWKKEAPQYE